MHEKNTTETGTRVQKHGWHRKIRVAAYAVPREQSKNFQRAKLLLILTKQRQTVSREIFRQDSSPFPRVIQLRFISPEDRAHTHDV